MRGVKAVSKVFDLSSWKNEVASDQDGQSEDGAGLG